MIQNGKKPITSKPQPTPLNQDDFFGNMLGIEPKILEAIKAMGKDYRFINAKQLQGMSGYHVHGWTPIKLADIKCDKIDLHSFQFGQDPSGYILRGDCVLAVRPTERGDQHRRYLKNEGERLQHSQLQRAHADEVRNLARQAGNSVKVHEGYEENE